MYSLKLLGCHSVAILGSALLSTSVFGQLAAERPVVSPATSVLVPGAVHEALVSDSPFPLRPQVIVLQPPPGAVPAAERPPQGSSDSIWIEGYWEWSQPLRQYTWLPGFWRRAPENLRWHAGAWVSAPDGVVRHPGYWYDAQRQPQLMRLAPPDKQEREATRRMTPPGTVWIRGGWTVDQQNQYQWEPGFVATEEEGLQWQPATVLPAAGGFAVVEGYWDYPVSERGTAYAAIQLPKADNFTEPLPDTGSAPDPSAKSDSITKAIANFNIELRAIDPLSIQRTAYGGWIYTRLLSPGPSVSQAKPLGRAVPSYRPHISDSGLVLDGQAKLTGIVRKGDLTPHYIKIKLLGGAARVTETDDDGRFEFAEIPYGRYSILAEGPVQNYFRSAAVIVDIDQPTAHVELELE